MDEIELPPDYNQYEPYMIGLLLDVSTNFHNGVRVIDTVKDQLVQFITSLEGEDRVYLFDGQSTEVPLRQGKAVQDVSRFNGVWGSHDIGEALKIMAALFSVEGRDYKRVIFYISDRYCFSSDPFVKEALEVVGRRDFDCKVVLVGVGDNYDVSLLGHDAAFGIEEAGSLKEDLIEVLKEEKWCKEGK